MDQKRKKWLIIVNLITLSRIVGSIFLFPIFFAYGQLVIGTILFFLFATDSIDGILARKYHVSTFFGSIMDGICDKVMIIVACTILCCVNKFMIISIILEVLIFIVNTFVLSQNGNVKSSRIGKLKMWVLSIFVVLGFFFSRKNRLIINILIAAPVIFFELITLIDYFMKIFTLKIKITLKKPKYKSYKEIRYMLFNPEFYDEYKDQKNLISHIYRNGSN